MLDILPNTEPQAMDEALLADLRFHQLLLGFDQDLARSACAQGCPYCRGRLHSARYWRKPRGLPVGLGEEYRQRFSFCCAVQECRKRKTPTSLRFLGPKVYAATIIVLVSVLRGGATAASMRRLQELVGVSRRTVTRWQRWWRETFVRTAVWQVIRATLREPVATDTLPASLLERFVGDAKSRLLSLLRSLGPLTGGAAMLAM
jgi:hypothetical protein